MILESEMRNVIIRIVLRVMLPLSDDAASNEAQEKANEIIGRIVTPAPGRTEPELNSNTARLLLKDLLARTNYKPMPDTEGTLRDLKSNERLITVIGTAVHLVFGHRQWKRKSSIHPRRVARARVLSRLPASEPAQLAGAVESGRRAIFPWRSELYCQPSWLL